MNYNYKMPDLDNINKLFNSETQNVIKSVDSLQNQLSQSFSEAIKIDFPSNYFAVKNIVVCGMGGSRFPALIIKNLYKDRIKVPFDIVDDYLLPKYINENSLVILSSYSGTTEEVIECFNKAKEKNACITSISAGGDISNYLKKLNKPLYVFNPIYNPSNQPRIGLGYPIGALIGILIKLKLIDEKEQEVQKSINKLQDNIKSFKVGVLEKNNPVKSVAIKTYEMYPYLIVSEFLTGVGNAIANQTNETAKSISSFRVIPELNHHLMEGLKHPDELKKIALFIFFFSNLYSERVKKRFKITKEVVEKNNIKTLWFELKGKTRLDQVFELIAFGSYFSMYLSILYNENPTTVPYVDYFKKRLSE
jgi:glucose/mannose-6-phosphate isomerase